MEKFLLTSQNFSGTKRLATGSLNLFQKISKISTANNIFIEAEMPVFEVSINWDEFIRPQSIYTAFMPLISKKLYSYQFQYLGNFEKNKSALIFGNKSEQNFCEQFSANLKNEKVFSFEDKQSNKCNLSWLLDVLMNNDKISSDSLRNERLIWQQSSIGFELILESISTDKKLTERQVFFFQNDFESVSWQHYVNIR